mmetsp:Transcript_16097/g.40358  ORF Transcript_16097/g.40358 Transcript_16097/m.40358 type:complete len:340 (-) Transcript_16097:298-1317(-)
MTGTNNVISAFLASVLLVSGVQGQTDLTLVACDSTAVGAERGSKFTTYEILCGKDSSDTALASVVTTTGATFATLCTLIDLTPVTTSYGNTIDIKTYLDTDANEHTFFAPTDAAFAKIQDDVDDLVATCNSGTEQLECGNIVSSWLQLHILPDTFLYEDLDCDETYDTLNIANNAIADQRQKTKCRGDAFTFDQLGAGNVGQSDLPTVGSPTGVFTLTEFATNTFTKVTTDLLTVSANVIGCNGVIHVVDEVLQPGTPFHGSKGSKGSQYYSGPYYGRGKSGRGYGRYRYRRYRPPYFPNYRNLEGEVEEADRDANLEDRRALLESLLIDAEGNTESLN